MQVQVTGKHVDVGDALRTRVADELSNSIGKYFDRGGGADVVVSKNSGGKATEAKLEVARELGLPVVMLGRPALPDADRTFDDPIALLDALGPLCR